MKLIELAIVLAAIVAGPAWASYQGDNYGKGDARRGAQGAVITGAIVAAYSVFCKREGDKNGL